jgi:hypothetical protein
MSWLLFLDESGTDHGSCPYEVTGGLALHASTLWPFIQDLRRRERDAFGGSLHEFGAELKGCKLLNRESYRWSAQMPPMSEPERQRHARGFMTKGLEKKPPTRAEFTAYGQARLCMARGIVESLRTHGAVLFATAIPRGSKRPKGRADEAYLRKDHVFLLERFFYFLELQKQHGILVMDEVEKTADRVLAQRMERYFERTAPGRSRTKWIVPSPFFVSSDMAYPVQAADLAIYCVNWGYRVPPGMINEAREEIRKEFEPLLRELEFHGDGARDGTVFNTHGVVYVPDPYTRR